MRLWQHQARVVAVVLLLLLQVVTPCPRAEGARVRVPRAFVDPQLQLQRCWVVPPSVTTCP